MAECQELTGGFSMFHHTGALSTLALKPGKGRVNTSEPASFGAWA